MLNTFKHGSSEKVFAIIERADLAGRERALWLGVFEFGTAISQWAEARCASGAAIARLGIQCALVVQGRTGAGNRMQHGFVCPEQWRVGIFNGDDEFVALRPFGDDDVGLLVQRTGNADALALAEGV